MLVMPMKNFNDANRLTQGFTLIELLVALFLGAVLIFGAIQVFDSSREGARVQNAMASIQDGGRVAMELISRDIRRADSSGCLADKSRIQNILDASTVNYLDDVHPFFNLGATAGQSGVTGVESALGDVITDFNPLTAVSTDLDVIDGTSILRVVGAAPACDGINALDNSSLDEDDPLRLRSACEIPEGTVLLVADCQRADIFVKTNPAGAGLVIEHAATAAGGFANTQPTFSKTYKYDAQILVPFVREYFVAQGSNGNNSLYRRDSGRVQELVTNVVDFQVIYGQDSNDNGAADIFAGTFADMSTVVSVRASLTVRSEQAIIREPGDVDSRPIIRNYTSTNGIRNRVVASSVGG